MKRLCLLSFLSASLLAVAGSGWAQAVSVDAESLIRRLDAMESRLDAAETGARRAVPASAASGNIGGLSSYTASDLDQRVTALENDASQLRGNSDRAVRAIEQLAKRFDDYIKDLDMRLADMETRMDAMSQKQTSAAVAAEPAVATAVDAKPAEGAVATPVAAPKPAAKADIPADLSAAEHYNKAYAYLTATEYKQSQAWFEEFLKRHASDPLADNAYYWLGEVYLVQNNPTSAAKSFRDGLKAFPKGGKAAANLYKMGVALEQLKQPKLARAAWQKLVNEYPKAPEVARAKDKLLQVKE